MLPQVPHWINVVFIILTLVTMTLFYFAANRSRNVFALMLVWITIQAALSMLGFYLIEDTIPPRMTLLAAPTLLVIAGLFLSKKGRAFLDSLDLKVLTGLHTIRIVVELVLYWLYLHQAVPQIMTFAGINFDILAGLSAPLILYFGFKSGQPNKRLLLVWNFACLLLLFNIVSVAALSAPTPLQQFGFEQPAIAILYFPYTWLPCIVVPIVLLAHLAAVRQLVVKH